MTPGMTVSAPHPPLTIPTAPSDPILTLYQEYLADPREHTINLSLGVYLGPNNELYEYKVVKSVITSLPPPQRAYLPISGHVQLRQLAKDLIYGVDSPNVALIHTVSGSCALRLAVSFCKRVLGKDTAYIANFTWPNHEHIAQAEGMKVRRYAYYTTHLQFERMLQDLQHAEKGSVIIFQACAHNPTGCDLNKQQWRQIETVVRGQMHIPVFDMAYQGLASGNLDEDAYAVRLFAKSGPTLCAQSFSKNMGVYNSRVGTVSYVGKDCANAQGQLMWLARGMYSSPPVEGASIVVEVLKRRGEWEREIEQVVRRVDGIREIVCREMGMTGEGGKGLFVKLDVDVGKLKEKGIYVTEDGRVNLGGVNQGNLERVLKAFKMCLI